MRPRPWEPASRPMSRQVNGALFPGECLQTPEGGELAIPSRPVRHRWREPKAAILDRQAKESRNWQAGQGHQQAKATPIGQARIAEHEADGTRAQQSWRPLACCGQNDIGIHAASANPPGLGRYENSVRPKARPSQRVSFTSSKMLILHLASLGCKPATVSNGSPRGVSAMG